MNERAQYSLWKHCKQGRTNQELDIVSSTRKTLSFKRERKVYSAEDKKKKTGRRTLCFIVQLFIERGRFHLDALAGQLLYCAPGDNGSYKVHSNSSKAATCRVGEKVTRGRGVTETRTRRVISKQCPLHGNAMVKKSEITLDTFCKVKWMWFRQLSIVYCCCLLIVGNTLKNSPFHFRRSLILLFVKGRNSESNLFLFYFIFLLHNTHTHTTSPRTDRLNKVRMKCIPTR